MVASTLDWLYPAKCALCGEFDDRPICPVCKSDMPSASDGQSPGPHPVGSHTALYRYTGRAAQAVRRLKYDRVLSHAGEMAQEMFVGLERFDATAYQAIVPVPIHWSRQCARGFNQAEVLSEALRAGGLPVRSDHLARTRRTRQQVGLNPAQRLANLKNAFRADASVNGMTILLIDDVITSGGTARECASTLLTAGALRVDLYTYCEGGATHDP